MDYSLLTEQQLQKKHDSLPDKLKELLTSENTIETVRQISRSHYLDEERSLIFEQLIGLVILGFLSVEELSQEIQKNLLLNPKHASELANDINRKIFEPIKSDLEKNYNPVMELPETKPTIKPGPEAKVEKEIAFKPAEPRPEAAPKPIEITELPKTAGLPKTEVQPTKAKPNIPPTPIPTEKPFIIHQETKAKAVTERNKTLMPTMGWFRKESSKAPESPIKVELETFGPKIEEKKEPAIAKTEAPKQRMVHYREVEVPTPFGKSFNETQGKPATQPLKETPPQKIEMPVVKPEFPKPITPITPAAPATKPEPPAKPAGPTFINLDSFSVTRENKKPNEVKLEGNTINLKNKPQ